MLKLRLLVGLNCLVAASAGAVGAAGITGAIWIVDPTGGAATRKLLADDARTEFERSVPVNTPCDCRVKCFEVGTRWVSSPVWDPPSGAVGTLKLRNCFTYNPKTFFVRYCPVASQRSGIVSCVLK